MEDKLGPRLAMLRTRSLLTTALLCYAWTARLSAGQTPPSSSDPAVFSATSRLVVLDVTVLDRKGQPVVKGLTKDDFTISERKAAQPILSFEAPDAHLPENNASAANPQGKAPATILVLDLLNSRFEDFAYIRYEVKKYLAAEPEHLKSPAELMVLGNRSLEMAQGFTRNKQDLLYALDHIPAALPYKEMNGSFMWERFAQSIDALQQIALQNKGVSGRKNIVWVGHGAPNIFTEVLTGSAVDMLNQYVHDTTNMLVDARISLFVIYPVLRVFSPGLSMSELSAGANIGDDDPFAGDINFGVFVRETGGNLFYNRNDIDNEIRRSQQLGSEYYTLSYRPPEGHADGKFRRIRVSLRDPNLTVITKAGYFAPQQGLPVDPRQSMLTNLTEAVQATIPFQTLAIHVADLTRHPETGRIEFVVEIQPKNVVWKAAENGKSEVSVVVAAASLTQNRDIIASRVQTVTISESADNSARVGEALPGVRMRLRVPKGTQAVRVAVQTAENGRMGTIELDRRTLDAAPVAPTPEKLLPPSRSSSLKP